MSQGGLCSECGSALPIPGARVGIVKGTISGRRCTVEPNDLFVESDAALCAALVKNKFPFGWKGAGTRTGWVEWSSPEDTDFKPYHWVIAEYRLLMLRVEKRKVPAPLLKVHLDKAVKLWLRDQGTLKIPAKVKKDLREQVEADLLDKVEPSVKLVEIVYDVKTKSVFIGALSDALFDAAVVAIKELLKCSLSPANLDIFSLDCTDALNDDLVDESYDEQDLRDQDLEDESLNDEVIDSANHADSSSHYDYADGEEDEVIVYRRPNAPPTYTKPISPPKETASKATPNSVNKESADKEKEVDTATAVDEEETPSLFYLWLWWAIENGVEIGCVESRLDGKIALQGFDVSTVVASETMADIPEARYAASCGRFPIGIRMNCILGELLVRYTVQGHLADINGLKISMQTPSEEVPEDEEDSNSNDSNNSKQPKRRIDVEAAVIDRMAILSQVEALVASQIKQFLSIFSNTTKWSAWMSVDKKKWLGR